MGREEGEGSRKGQKTKGESRRASSQRTHMHEGFGPNFLYINVHYIKKYIIRYPFIHSKF